MAYTNIDDPSAYFQVATYTGSNNQSITNNGNSDLQPDFVWIKRRSDPDHHSLTNSSLGVNKQLLSSSTNGEQSRTDQIQSFNTDGFTLGTDGAGYTNIPGNTYVAWQWKANGGTTASNSDGSITSTVQANTDAGFSIVQYTGTGTAATIGHGLGVAPAMYIVKNRNQQGTDWTIFHKNLTSNAYSLYFNTAAQSNSVGYWNGTSPTSSVFSIKNTSGDVNTNNENYVVYCFAEKQGYSKFGKYVGNGNDNGPFIYTGFKPAFVLTKGTNVSQWRLYDSARSPNNVNINRLFPYSTAAEATDTDAGIDMLSNGFKIRGSGGDYNASGTTYIYMAFAENPFVTSTRIPTTAR